MDNQQLMKARILTDRQREILDFIVKIIRIDLRPPSFSEIMSEFGFKGKNSINDHVVALERKGYIESDVKTRMKRITLTIKARDEYGLWFIGNNKE